MESKGRIAQRQNGKKRVQGGSGIQEFIIKGVEAGKLEFRYSSVWGSPFIRILRRQLEEYITSELGPEYLAKARGKIELQKIKKEIAEIEQNLIAQQTRKAELVAKKTKLEESMSPPASGKSPKKLKTDPHGDIR